MSQQPPHPHEPVQRFKPTGGTVIGYASLVAGAVVVGLVVVTQPTLAGLRTCLAVGIVAVLVWMALLRPRATAYDDVLVLRNLATDTHVPLARIDEVVVRHTLNVWVGDDRYVCIGIGRSTRRLVGRRDHGPLAVLGVEHDDARWGFGGQHDDAADRDYAGFVETRIVDLARTARRDLRGEPPAVRRVWAVPELTVLGILAAALVVTLFLG